MVPVPDERAWSNAQEEPCATCHAGEPAGTPQAELAVDHDGGQQALCQSRTSVLVSFLQIRNDFLEDGIPLQKAPGLQQRQILSPVILAVKSIECKCEVTQMTEADACTHGMVKDMCIEEEELPHGTVGLKAMTVVLHHYAVQYIVHVTVAVGLKIAPVLAGSHQRRHPTLRVGKPPVYITTHAQVRLRVEGCCRASLELHGLDATPRPGCCLNVRDMRYMAIPRPYAPGGLTPFLQKRGRHSGLWRQRGNGRIQHTLDLMKDGLMVQMQPLVTRKYDTIASTIPKCVSEQFNQHMI